MELSDQELLKRYLSHHDEAAFRLLVDRHLPLVHGVALRLTRDVGHASDISQQVMIRLAERAAIASRATGLAAWLHRITRHMAIDFIRKEDRRRLREKATVLDASSGVAEAGANWAAVAPLIDEMVDRLPPADRQIVLLRFYSNLTHPAIAAQLGMTEEGVRKRSTRALERLRSMFAKQGISATPAALSSILPAHACSPVPSAVGASVHQATLHLAPKTFTSLVLMTASQNAAVAAAAMIFLGSLGYVWACASEPPAVAVAPIAAATAPPPPAPLVQRARPPRQPMPDTREGRFERLKAILAIPGTFDRAAEMLDFLDEFPPSAFGEIAEDLKTFQSGQNNGAEFGVLAAMWAKVDPQAAAAFTTANPSLGMSGEVLKTWASIDPDAALAWAEANPNNGAINSRLITVLAGIARSNPKPAIEYLSGLQDPAKKTFAISRIYASMADQPNAVEKLFPAADTPEMRQKLLTFAMATVSAQEIAREVSMVREKFSDEAPAIYRAAFRNWASKDEEGATQALAQLVDSPGYREAFTGYCSAMAAMDPTRVLPLLKQHPGVVLDSELMEIASSIREVDPAGAVEAIGTIRDTSLREKTLVDHLSHWLSQDPAEAGEWIRHANLPDSVVQQLSDSIE